MITIGFHAVVIVGAINLEVVPVDQRNSILSPRMMCDIVYADTENRFIIVNRTFQVEERLITGFISVLYVHTQSRSTQAPHVGMHKRDSTSLAPSDICLIPSTSTEDLH